MHFIQSPFGAYLMLRPWLANLFRPNPAGAEQKKPITWGRH